MEKINKLYFLIFNKESKIHSFFLLFIYIQWQINTRWQRIYTKALQSVLQKESVHTQRWFSLLFYSQPAVLPQNNTSIEDTNSFYWSASLSVPSCDKIQSLVQLWCGNASDFNLIMSSPKRPKKNLNQKEAMLNLNKKLHFYLRKFKAIWDDRAEIRCVYCSLLTHHDFVGCSWISAAV